MPRVTQRFPKSTLRKLAPQFSALFRLLALEKNFKN
jgi:hypothetical protein